MRGRQQTQQSLFACVRLEEMIPHDHVLRRIQEAIDFSFIDRLTAPLYSTTGRPSVDPQVLVRMMVVGYLYGITSERRLCEEVQLNLAYRWFCGLGLEDRVPDHSTFSKNRHGRFAERPLFREMFYEVVRQALAHGLVRGTHLTVDATTVQANAAVNSLEPIVVSFSPAQYVAQLEGQNPPPLSNETHRSGSDPDARLLAKRFDKTQLAYSNNVLMDNAHRVIVEVEVTEPNLRQEGQVAGELIERSRLRLGLTPQIVGGDMAYGYGAAVRRLHEAGVEVHAPAPTQGQHSTQGIFGKERFHYDRARDELICPAGQRLRRRTAHERNRQIEYASRVAACGNCALKSQCTRSDHRVVHRHWDQDHLDRAAKARQTPAYLWSQRQRKCIEHLFAEAKEQMGLRRARRRGWAQVSEQCLLTALVQNIKRIVAAVSRRPAIALSVVAVAPRRPALAWLPNLRQMQELLMGSWRQFHALPSPLISGLN